MQKIVVSAFTPFGSYLVNSTERTLEILVERKSFDIIPIVYDATIPRNNRGKKLIDLAFKHRASGILSLGMASEKKGVCIERYASNAIDNEKYCPPLLQKTAIRTDRAYDERVSLDLEPWCIDRFLKRCAERSIPAEESTDAGGFCCNHLAYQTQRALLEKEIRLPFLFIHLPCCLESVPNMEDFTRAGKVLCSPAVMADALELLVAGATL